jgi:BirA family transcriptional regulator, biotin operon repressor / biotin---[acetyl-CoA-carboxylase] ligase
MDPLHAIPSEVIGRWMVHRVEETGSTNDDLWAAAQAGAPDRSALVAGFQSAGHGRLDRRWDAPPGANMLVSLLFRTVPSNPHVLTHAVALAARSAAASVAQVNAELKWPNDLLVDGRKLAGLLAVAGPFAGDRPEFVIIGLGLNVNWAPDDAVSLGSASGNGPYEVDEVLRAFLGALDLLLESSESQINDVYRRHLSTLRREVRIELPDGETIEGRALDVESDGRLVVLDRCGVTRRLAVGDIVHVRTTNFDA